jgi:hypothetical protein
MTIVAFAGPSLPGIDRDAYAGVAWRPPAEAGDLLRLPDGCRTVCLIDGYFDHRPAVRHKEILLLLSRGVRIFGAGSIGALRAAEMRGFGMIGIGAVYRAYARGTISADAEVALAHAPADWDWRPLSVPLVDVRAALCRCLRVRQVTAAEARAVLHAAARLHYLDRTWADVLATARLWAPARRRLAAWLAAAPVSQKRCDARACIAAALREPSPSPGPRPRMVMTPFVEALARACGAAPPARPPERGREGPAESPCARDCGTIRGRKTMP